MTGPTHAERLAALPAKTRTPLGPLAKLGGSPPVFLRKPARAASGMGSKRLARLDDAFDALEIRDGQTLSFHHHYRNGDRLMAAVLATAARRGIQGLVIAPSSLFPVHAPLVPLIENGTIAGIVTDYMRGPVADCVQAGRLLGPAVLQSHGARARAIVSGQLPIDVAFIAAPVAQADGTTTGRTGRNACGPLGYAAVDAAHAQRSLVAAGLVTDGLVPRVDIPGHQVDAVIEVADPGRADGIAWGTAVASYSAESNRIGGFVADVVAASGVMQEGLTLQSGAGGYSLGAVEKIGARMAAAGIRGRFMSGGIAAMHTRLLRDGLFDQIWDVQCFDSDAVRSAGEHPAHKMMSADLYANPLHPRAIADQLSVMILGAAEIDLDFNVNVVRGGGGAVLGGPGGHPDTAQGADLSIVTTSLVGGGYAKVVPQVAAVVTPGACIDVLVTDQGVAVHPGRPALEARLKGAGLPVRPIDALASRAATLATKARQPAAEAPTILIERRDGVILDWV